MKHETEFLRSTDGTELHLQHWQPDAQRPRAVVGIIHGWSDHGGRYKHVVEHFVPAGLAVYALDLRGHGKSDGQRGHVDRWADYRADAGTFISLLESRLPETPIFIMGHSMGGLVLLEYAVHHPKHDLNGIIASSPLLSKPNVMPGLTQIGRVLSRLVPRFSINPGASKNTLSRDPTTAIKYEKDPLVHQRVSARASVEMSGAQDFTLDNLDAVRYPLLLMYGDDDQLVPPHMNRETFEHIGAADKTRHEYEGGYHELFNDIIREQVLADTLDWINNHT